MRESKRANPQEAATSTTASTQPSAPSYSSKQPAAESLALATQSRIRSDATWSVPEPELTLVIAPTGEIIGYTIGNDMSSRDIEGENPLYLPQAKVYDGSCALGPCILHRKRAPRQIYRHPNRNHPPDAEARLHGK